MAFLYCSGKLPERRYDLGFPHRDQAAAEDADSFHWGGKSGCLSERLDRG